MVNLDPRNPLGLDGFEFCEFTSPDPDAMAAQLQLLGFVPASTHPGKAVTRYKQGRINLLLNREPHGQAADFRAAHGASASGMAFRVQDAAAAFEAALARGGQAADAQAGTLGAGSHVLQGIGGSYLYLVDRYGERGDLYDDWVAVPGAEQAEASNSVGLDLIDHLTHNLRRGEMRTWSNFYAQIFGFQEQKFFDIKGKATGLFSQAMVAPDGAIRIPLNESQDENSQIEEFIREYKGEGIQHLALATNDIFTTVEKLRARGVRLQHTIDTYYDLIDKRIPGHGEDIERLRRNRILIDGEVEREGILLQIFTENLFGPIFFEIIQRKGNNGFGAGNFQALYESIELDQIRRGVLTVET
jgi:4-hydroxyphenylpyruvate dioxygenase